MKLSKSGRRYFKDAVEHGSSGETPSAQIRTEFRSLRKIHRRDRNRRADLLLLLSREGFAPEIPEEDIRRWRQEAVFPLSNSLMSWMNVNAMEGKNPYADRHECLHRKLDFSLREERYIFGRALYHLGQRRGYMMDRNDDSVSKGVVLKAIENLTDEILSAGCEFLGDYFHSIYGKKKIRSRYLSCPAHVKAEFDEICRVQEIGDELKAQLHSCIFRNTPLKSQKWQVGRCVYEKDRARCKKSHPLHEESMFLQTLNNIKVKAPGNEDFHPLDNEQIRLIKPLFFRKSKPNFTFDEVAARIAGQKREKKGKGDEGLKGYEFGGYAFNYRMDQPVGGCPVTGAIISALGPEANCENWRSVLHSRYVPSPGKGGKTEDEVINDVWHMLEFFDDNTLQRQTEWLMTHIKGMDQSHARSLAGTALKGDYGNLSIKALNKILPYLREGWQYSDAIMLANVRECLPDSVREDAALCETALGDIKGIIHDFHNMTAAQKANQSLKDRITEYICAIEPGSEHMGNLWTKDQMSEFRPVKDYRTGIMKLPAAITNSFKSPFVARCLSQAGTVVNALLTDGVIDADTTINYCLSSTVNTLNMRSAVYKQNTDNFKERAKAMKELESLHVAPSEENVLRYLLWEEQNHIDPLSGEEIGASEAFDSRKTFTDHIVPVSMNGGDSVVNRILIKHSSAKKRDGVMPASAIDPDILRANASKMGWFNTIYKLEKDHNRLSMAAKGAAMKKDKDSAITSRNKSDFKLRYWKSKLSRLTTTKHVDDSASALSGQYGAVDKYLKNYLKAVFGNINGIGADGIAEFRRLWGIGEVAGNESDNILDAITAACISKNDYERYCRYRRDLDANRAYGKTLEGFGIPWGGFRDDALEACRTLISSNRIDNNSIKKTKRKLRDSRGRIMRNADGEPIYQTGDSWRGALHQATYYGLREIDGTPTSVIRTDVTALDAKDLDSIIDPELRNGFARLIHEYGSVKEAYEAGHCVTNNEGFTVRHVLTRASKKNLLTLRDCPSPSKDRLKNKVYVANEENYCMVIHHDGNGKVTFDMYNNLEAATFFRKHRRMPGKDKPTDQLIRKGVMVIQCIESRDELKGLSWAELSKRLYRVVAIGRQMKLRHHMDTDTKEFPTYWKPDSETPQPTLVQQFSRYPLAVEGEDFIITKTSEIKFLF